MTGPPTVLADTSPDSVQETAREMATQLGVGFQAHDSGRKADAIDAFAYVDTHQFPFLDEEAVRHAASAFVEALWAKDDVELQYLTDGELDREGVRDADYAPVKRKLRERASVIGADPRYATEKADAWRLHKSGGEYWTPFARSQLYELRAALRDPSYPNKPRAGDAGPGPEPLRYVLAFELHDMHTRRHWEEGSAVMAPYFARILEEHRDESH